MARGSAALKVVPATPPTLGDLIDQLEDNRRARRPIEAQLKPLEDAATALKASIITMLDSDNSVKSGTTRATVSISDIERVVIEDADVMVKALKKDGYMHILDLKVVAAKEYLEKKGKEIPGTSTQVVRRQLNHTSLK